MKLLIKFHCTALNQMSFLCTPHTQYIIFIGETLWIIDIQKWKTLKQKCNIYSYRLFLYIGTPYCELLFSIKLQVSTLFLVVWLTVNTV